MELDHGDWCNCCFFSSDNSLIMSCGFNGKIKLWDKEGNLLKEINSGSNVYCCCFSSCGYNEKIKLWDVNGRLINEFNHRYPVLHCCFSSDDSLILASNAKGKV